MGVGAAHEVESMLTPRVLDRGDGRWVRMRGGVMLRVWTDPQAVRRRRRTRGEVIRLAVALAIGFLASVAVR